MRLIRLAIRNVAGHSFRSWMVFFCATLMAALVISSTLILGGANDSLRLAVERLGADIIVVPKGLEQRLESALLMGIPAYGWMADTVPDDIAALPGVEAVSPQIYLSTLRGATCCSVPEMFLIAYDPVTDFTVRPWLESTLGEGLDLGEAVGGSLVYVPADDDGLLVYGYSLDLKANLAPTGTGLDQSLFFTMETAYDIALNSPDQAARALDIPPRTVSSALVRVAQHEDIPRVAQEIRATITGVSALETANLFQDQRQQMQSLLRSVAALLAVIWALAVALIAIVFALAVNERRRQIGVMRALGARRSTVLTSLLAEAWLLAGSGGLTGVFVAALAIALFQRAITHMLGVPFLYPPIGQLAALGAGALAFALVSASLAALGPALRISYQDPALAMKE
jgi:putative ABC transport system permease protein